MRPILFHLPEALGGLAIPTYGVVVALGCVVGALVFAWAARRTGFDGSRAFEIALEPIVVAFVVGKSVAFAFSPPSDLPAWQHLLKTGGIWYVGFLAGVAWATWAVRRFGMGLWQGLDHAALAVSVGHGIGRLACLFAGCCHGRACAMPWAVTYTNETAHALTGVPLGVGLHPTPIYESAAELTLAAVLAWVLLRKNRFDGLTSLLYLIGYAGLRFVVEFFRGDFRGSLGPLSTSQAIATGLLLVSVPLLAWGWRRGGLPFGGRPNR